jgi:hypothetical protein
MATNMMQIPDCEPIPLSSRFAKLKRNMIACREKDVAESFYRLLRALRREADEISAAESSIIPTIDYFDIHDAAKASAFKQALRKRGVAVIKRVVPPTVAQAWKDETLDYMADNPQTKGYPRHDPQLFDLYWSPGQVRARADSRLLDAQRFAMSTWHASDEDALVSGEYPVAYADRLRVRTQDDASLGMGIGGGGVGVHVDNGSVERWEPDGYGASGTYGPIFQGRWEDYDPWDSTPRLHMTTDLYNRAGSCSMFRMFQGFLSLSAIPTGSGSLTVCPMLQLSTAYLLLRPFFTPRYKNPATNKMGMGNDNNNSDIPRGMNLNMGLGATRTLRTEMDYLHPNNWNLNVSQTSILHGAMPGSVQEVSSVFHPHLQLHRTMVSIPDIEPGDYVIWHPDAVHAVDTAPAYFPGMNTNPSSNSDFISSYSPLNFALNPASPNYSFLPGSAFSPSPTFNSNTTFNFTNYPSTSTSSIASLPSSYAQSHANSHSHSHTRTSTNSSVTNITYPPSCSEPPNPSSDATVLYIPACPLTQTNALYLSRQRRAFLLGLPAPDFFESGSSPGERDHTGRSGVQDVADAGGEEGLRSMGLTPWEKIRRGGGVSGGGGGSGEDGGSVTYEKGIREKEKDARLLRLANSILFPDRFDGVVKKGGGR